MENRKIVPIWTTLGYREQADSYIYTFDTVTLPDYGGIGVDLKASENDNQVQCVSYKKENENHFLGFQARNYCLPFTKPNEISYLSDPCLKIVDRFLKNQALFCSKLANYRNYSRNTKKQPIIREAFETLKKLSEGTLNVKEPLEIYVPKQFMELLKLYPNPFPTLNSNWLYTGGCLTVVDNKTLLRCGGQRFDNLVLTTLEENENDDNDKIFSVQNEKTINFNDGSKIHQIVYQETLKRRFCVVRKKCHCDIFSVIENDGLLDFNLLKTNHSNELLSSVAISPHVPGEILTANNMGYLQLQSLTSDKIIWKTENEFEHENLSDISNDWWISDFGPHPRSLLYMDRSNFKKADLRSKDFISQKLLSSNNQYIQGEDLMLFKGNYFNDLQYFASSSYHLTLIDERFAQKPVQIWSHHLKTPPLYWSQTILEKENQLLFLLASQNSKETSCLQLDCRTDAIQPISLGSMWHLASPGDFIKILSLQGNSFPPEIETRTSLPLIGVQVVPHRRKSGFTLFQLTSVGDIYYQDYFPQTTRGERNFHYGSGCEFLDEKLILEQCSSWLKEAYKEARPTDEQQFEPESAINIQSVLNSMQNGPPSSESCPVCFEQPSTSKNQICPGCGCNEMLAFSILKAKQECGIISKFILEETTNQQENSSEKDKLNLIDLDRHFDPFSRKILSVWMEREKSDLLGQVTQEGTVVEEEAEMFAAILNPEVTFFELPEINDPSFITPVVSGIPEVEAIQQGPETFSSQKTQNTMENTNMTDADWFFQSPKTSKRKSKPTSAKKTNTVGF